MSVPPSLGKCEDSTFDRDGTENNFCFSEVSFVVGGECLDLLVVRSLDNDDLSTRVIPAAKFSQSYDVLFFRRMRTRSLSRS